MPGITKAVQITVLGDLDSLTAFARTAETSQAFPAISIAFPESILGYINNVLLLLGMRGDQKYEHNRHKSDSCCDH